MTHSIYGKIPDFNPPAAIRHITWWIPGGRVAGKIPNKFQIFNIKNHKV